MKMEPAPFPIDKLINQRAFGHACDIRRENPGSLGKIVMFFHQQVEDYLQGDQQFIIRTLWKTKGQLNEELEKLGLKDWWVKDSECFIIAKIAILYKSAKVAQKYDHHNRAYCKQYASNAEEIVAKACQQYQSDIFNEMMFEAHDATDRVCRVFNSLATNAVTALEAISGKVVAWHRILFFINNLSLFLADENRRRRSQTSPGVCNFNAWDSNKVDLLDEITCFFSYQ